MSTASDLAGVLAGASIGYLDAQSGSPVTATEPGFGTQFGLAGFGQPVTAPASANGAAATLSTSNPLLLIGILVVGLVLFMKR